jgi:hypothetical protein
MARSPEKQRIPDEPAEKLRPSLLSEIQGMALRWFRRENPPEVWDARLERPTGDIEAAQRIRDICRSAAGSAEKISGLAGNLDSNRKKYEADRYEAAARAAMEIAMKIADDLLRDSSVRQIVGLCLKANDLRTARILFRAIQAASIREEMLREQPILRQ